MKRLPERRNDGAPDAEENRALNELQRIPWMIPVSRPLEIEHGETP